MHGVIIGDMLIENAVLHLDNQNVLSVKFMTDKELDELSILFGPENTTKILMQDDSGETTMNIGNKNLIFLQVDDVKTQRNVSAEFYVKPMSVKDDEGVKAEITTLAKAGAEQVKTYCADTGKEPKEDSGIFVKGVDAWGPRKNYAVNDLFSYNGAMGYVKQAHTSQEAWIPFTQGTEALYGARPAPDAEGIYPYVYNMAVSVGMMVRDPDGKVYECTQAVNDMLYAPSAIPAHFKVIA